MMVLPIEPSTQFNFILYQFKRNKKYLLYLRGSPKGHITHHKTIAERGRERMCTNRLTRSPFAKVNQWTTGSRMISSQDPHYTLKNNRRPQNSSICVRNVYCYYCQKLKVQMFKHLLNLLNKIRTINPSHAKINKILSEKQLYIFPKEKINKKSGTVLYFCKSL